MPRTFKSVFLASFVFSLALGCTKPQSPSSGTNNTTVTDDFEVNDSATAEQSTSTDTVLGDSVVDVSR